MRPRVIVHQSVSIDGAVAGFDLDPASHYGALGELEASGFLVDAAVALDGVDDDVPAETTRTGRRARPIRRMLAPSGSSSTQAAARRKAPRGAALPNQGRRRARLRVDTRVVPPMARGETLPVPRGRNRRRRSREGARARARAAWRGAHRDRRGTRTGGALFAADVVDELSLLVFPSLVAGASERLFQRLPGSVKLDLGDAWALESGAIHLRWTVRRS